MEQILSTSIIPKVPLGLYPTPLQELPNMSRILGSEKRLFLKREDLCGVGFGGNKIRKLEYLLAEALEQGCDCIVTGGGSQSNQTIAAAACANRLGLEAHLVMPASAGPAMRHLVGLLGARFHEVENADGLGKGVRATAAELRKQGHKPYVIPPGASTARSILGYVGAMCELYTQANTAGIHVDHVVCGGGTGNTYAGVALGTKMFSPSTKATVVSIGRRFCHKKTICGMIHKAKELLGFGVDVSEDDLHVHFSCGKGLGVESPGGKAGMQKMASLEGVFLDPVYTGKAFAGVLELNQAGVFLPGQIVVFIHTGGITTLFGSVEGRTNRERCICPQVS